MLTISAVIGVYLHRWRDSNSLLGKQKDKEERRKPLGGNPFAGISTTFKSSYLIAIAIFVVFASASSTFIYFELMRIVAIDYPYRTQQTQIFSMIDLFVNTCTLLLQIFITGRIAEHLGLGILLVTVPIVIALGFIWLAFMPLFAVPVTVMIVRRIGRYAMVRLAREMLYAVLTPEEKYKSKNFIDTVLYRAGDMTSAWLSKGLDLLDGEHSILAMIGGAIIAGGWAITGMILTKLQQRKASVVNKARNE